MIVADTSALISLATADVLGSVLDEFDVHTTTIVVDELEETAEYDDPHGIAAAQVLDRLDGGTVHATTGDVQSTRIDAGEASCLALEYGLDAEFLLTDDLRALPEHQPLAEARVAISPIVLRALVKRGVLTTDEALDRLDHVATTRDWLGAPIYHRAKRLFDDT